MFAKARQTRDKARVDAAFLASILTGRDGVDFHNGAVIDGALARATLSRISPPGFALVARGETLSAFDCIRSKNAQQALVREFAALMASFDAALSAPVMGEAPPGDGLRDALDPRHK